MPNTDISGDTRYLFKRDKTWWVKLAVPRPLRETLGYDLRRSLHTHDIEAARETRWEVIEEFRAQIEQAQQELEPEGEAPQPVKSGTRPGRVAVR